MDCILISPNGTIEKIYITSPADVFGNGKFTIIGACIELGYVYIGYIDAINETLAPNKHIPPKLMVQSVFDERIVRGPILIVQTDSFGNPINIVFDF